MLVIGGHQRTQSIMVVPAATDPWPGHSPHAGPTLSLLLMRIFHLADAELISEYVQRRSKLVQNTEGSHHVYVNPWSKP